MALFKNAHESHQHSLELLNMIYGYDSFLDNLSVIADMGCGAGFDAAWWATLQTRDDPPEPRNYKVYAVDKNINNIDQAILGFNNVQVIQADIDITNNTDLNITPEKVDLLWCHDTFQYVTNPLPSLAN